MDRTPTTDEIVESLEQPQSYHALLAARADEVNAQLAAEWDTILQDESKFKEVIGQRKSAFKAKAKLLRESLSKVVSNEWAEHKKASAKSPQDRAADHRTYLDSLKDQTEFSALKRNLNLKGNTPAELIEELEWVIANNWKWVDRKETRALITKLQKAIVQLGGTPDPGCDVERHLAWKAWWDNKELPHTPAPAGPSRLRTPAAPSTAPANQPSEAEMDALLDAKSSATPPPDEQSEQDDGSWLKD